MHTNGRQNGQEIPDIVIRRLPIYCRMLKRLLADGATTVSSDELAAHIGVTAAQIRRDLSYFGRFGTQGKGYDVALLIEEIHRILNLDRAWDVALAGFGNLGRAIADYRGFEASSFRIAAIFDHNAERVGQRNERGVLVQPASEIVQTVQALGIKMGIVAVPAASAQAVTDEFVEGGVQALLNYAPVTLKTPEHVWVREIDPTGAMQSMTYYLERDDLSHDDSPSEAPARRAVAPTYDAASGS